VITGAKLRHAITINMPPAPSVETPGHIARVFPRAHCSWSLGAPSLETKCAMCVAIRDIPRRPVRRDRVPLAILEPPGRARSPDPITQAASTFQHVRDGLHGISSQVELRAPWRHAPAGPSLLSTTAAYAIHTLCGQLTRRNYLTRRT
jgi:hypothetical protein